MALVAIVALAIVATLYVTRADGSAGSSGAPGPGGSGFASADDAGPAGIITDDSTCEAWRTISHDMEAVSDAVKWNEQDYSVPAAQWNADQRNAFEKKSASLGSAVPKVESLAKQTPHRVMRELYGQYIAYTQAWIDAVPTYSATDRDSVATSNQLFTVLNRVCDAIYFRAAQQLAPLIAAAAPPSDVQALQGEAQPATEPFMNQGDASCEDWRAMIDRFEQDSRMKAWNDLDPNVRASERTPEYTAVVDAVLPVLGTYADDMERLGRQSGNPVWEDFAVTAAQYMRAYIQGAPTYRPAYGLLSLTSTILANSVNWACKAHA
ncbi:hypothetical protein H7J87_12435 [Mycolicibacterium wolinskyi]|uniref:hypothetical protein n=1 Tax=Mycolicibacterium TaxID=1866885 RepID=UPI0010552B57|nr:MULTISPECIES: hypothetical protein [Mycolicibacterium]MCV7286136.1 hypothetical protein [Mycolicibacterium wolinskyi]MCV7296332.1 hypothetical protein [Mycolicibacterium goodii]